MNEGIASIICRRKVLERCREISTTKRRKRKMKREIKQRKCLEKRGAYLSKRECRRETAPKRAQRTQQSSEEWLRRMENHYKKNLES